MSPGSPRHRRWPADDDHLSGTGTGTGTGGVGTGTGGIGGAGRSAVSGGVKAAVRERALRARYLARRASPVPVLVRASLWLVGAAAFALAFPSTVLLGPGALALLVLALGPAVWPGGRWPTVVIAVAVFGWLTGTTVYAEPITLGRLVLLSGLLYVVHTMSALAAQMPYDAVVTPGVPIRWLGRAVLVVLVSGLVALVLLLVPAFLGQGRYLMAAVLGLVIMAVLTGLLARAAR